MDKQEKAQQKSAAASREERILDFWRENTIFEKSVNRKENPAGEFVFYEGPPGANGVPMLHHFEARAFKDVIPRYKTMRGFHVDRRAGWDCHGLPVELQAEKELGLKSKKEIETFGIAKYNAYCREIVKKYTNEWETFTERMGYWVDNTRAYNTMDNSFIESSWWVVSQAEKKGYLIKDYKILPWCARCGTGLSSHELGQPGVYVDVKDLSVTAKFPIVGFDKAYFLAWTTTPWTLPGNVALAVGADIVYVEAKVATKDGDEILVLAKERLSVITEPYEIIAEHKGSEMVGMKYTPLYDTNIGNEKSFQVYLADFVNTTDGTGIVHTAVMYGADDFVLGTELGLPKIHTVDAEGKFICEIDFLKGRFVKDEQVAIDIIKDLAHRGLLFKKEKYEHSYPHCWRCKTPLIYYARDSWYFAMSKLREELLARNATINWEPEHIKDGRFGEWLREIKDWAISRERYWGTPLPVWINKSGGRVVVDSIETLKKHTKKSGNKYFVMRHGEAENNELHILSTSLTNQHHLTEKGKTQVAESAKFLKDKDIDIIISSPFLRTKETAEITAEVIGFPKEEIIFSEELVEIKAGVLDGKPIKQWQEEFPPINLFKKGPEDGETLQQVKNRIGDFLYKLENKYKNKNILIVSHGDPTWMISSVVQGTSQGETVEFEKDNYLKNAEIRPLDFVPLPHNENYELDLHKPFIDDVMLVDENGEEMTRVKEVMDVWFDSGAMPLAQDHYPFENKEWVDGAGYPADFISEAIDQTRGWFYTLVAVSALIDRPAPFKNVICLGHLLDAQGQKMSKSKGNVIDPWEEMNTYGADTVRMWMFSVTQPGDSKNYDPKVVRELHNKIFGLLGNVMAFYELYRDKDLENARSTISGKTSSNILDVWILARLNQFTALVTESLDNYKIFEPARGFRDFIDDLSTWYLRRSRERLKDGDADAKQTLYFVLKTLAKLLAPFAPFMAEDIWQKLKNEGDAMSVHLAMWPHSTEVSRGAAEGEVLEKMQTVREIVTKGLELRQKAGIKIRQPLQSFTFESAGLENYHDILKDELNVKEIKSGELNLDTNITSELKLEGDYRELVRAIQDMRKEMNLTPKDLIAVSISSEMEAIVMPFMDEFQKTVQAKEVKFNLAQGTQPEIAKL